MPEPEPPLARVTQRVADTAKKMVNESADVVFAESKIIDADKYEMKDAIDTVTKLAGIGITGAAHIGRITIEEKPPDTVLAMGEYIASIVRRMVTQTGAVAKDASVEVEKKQYTPNKWLESMTRMIDIGIAGGMEIIETVAAGPARFQVQPIPSEEFTMRAAKGGEPRTLKLDKAGLKRDATDEPIPPTKVTFDPPTLVPPNTKFKVLVDASDLLSGIYEGKVVAEYAPRKKKGEKRPSADSMTVAISL
jgi:hypothetical protein